jgi:hypothetical protein
MTRLASILAFIFAVPSMGRFFRMNIESAGENGR